MAITVENIEVCEQSYKRQKLESGEAKVGKWQNASEGSSLNSDKKNYLYFNGHGDPEYAKNMKEVLDISFSSDEEE